MNSSIRSWLAPGAAVAGSGRRVFRILAPARLKIRSSSLPASASRASIGTSRRQSEDQSSEIKRTRAGPPGCATSHVIASHSDQVLGAADVGEVLLEGHAAGETLGRHDVLGHGPPPHGRVIVVPSPVAVTENM